MALITDLGLDVEALERLGRQLELSKEDIAATVGVDPTTLWRWRTERASPRGSALSRLTQLGELADLLMRLFAGPDLARKWLRDARPEMLSGEKTPLEVMREGRIDRVLTTLQFLARGA